MVQVMCNLPRDIIIYENAVLCKTMLFCTKLDCKGLMQSYTNSGSFIVCIMLHYKPCFFISRKIQEQKANKVRCVLIFTRNSNIAHSRLKLVVVWIPLIIQFRCLSWLVQALNFSPIKKVKFQPF